MCIFFQVEPPVFVATGAWGIASIDIGADGIADFVVADEATGQVTLLGSNGSGGFSSETSFKVGTGPEGIAVGDFNGDGNPDVVAANSGSNTVSVLINNGKGGFDKAITVSVGKDPTSVTTASINDEKWSDIIVADGASNQVTVLTSNGAATPKFTAANYAVGKGPTSVAAADLVPGGRPDLIATDGGAGEISVLINNGHGGFDAAANYAVGDSKSSDPMAVATANLNGGSAPDVIVANGDGSVSVLLNEGNGTLAPAQTFQVGVDLTAITTATLDNSGMPDILVADASTDCIYVLAYENGSLVNLDALNFPAAVVSMAVADVNDDGRPDIVATLANGDVDVVLNTAYYSAAQAIAAYAANPTLTGMTVYDTGANIGANLNALQVLAAGGALSGVIDSDDSPVPLSAHQLFADYAVLNELGYSPLDLTSGPLQLANGYLEAAYGSVQFGGTLTNSGPLQATAANGALTLLGVFSFPSGSPGEFVNAGTLTLSNGFQLTIESVVENTGSILVSGGALLDILGTPLTNTGVVTLDDATLQIGGEVAVASLGSVDNVGGVVEITGDLIGPGVLDVGSGGALGTVMLEGTIAYATIVDTTGNGIEFFGPALNAGNGVLQNVTYEGTLGLGLHDDEVSVNGGLTLLGANGTGPGTIQLTGSAARLNLNGIGTLNSATVYIGSEFKYDESVLYAAGPALTLGSSLAIVQVQVGALIESDLGLGDGIVNDGAISAAVAGGDLVVRGADFTNKGALTVGNGEAVYLDTTQVGNIAGGVLTGGTWTVGGASTLWLPTNAGVTTLAANLTLSGSGAATPTVEWFATAAEADVTLQQTLATVAAAGVLTLSGGWTFDDTSGGPNGVVVQGNIVLAGATLQDPALDVAAGGHLTGYGSVIGPDIDSGAISDNGTITASGGLFDLAGAVNGGGTLAIDAHATLELQPSDLAGIKVQFAAATGDLWLLDPTQTTIAGFVKGDTIDLGSFIETGFTYHANTHVLTISGGSGASVSLTFVGTYTQSSFSFASDGNGGTLLTDPPAKQVASALASVSASPELVGLPPGGTIAAAPPPAVSPDPLADAATGVADAVDVVAKPAIWTPGHC